MRCAVWCGVLGAALIALALWPPTATYRKDAPVCVVTHEP